MSDTFSYEDAAKPAQPIKDAAKPFSYEEATGETTARGLKGWGRDIAATAVKGAIAVPEALVGLADIPTGGAVGKFLENEGGAVGFRPKQAKEIVNEWHSDATKEAQRKFQEADGIVDKAATAIQNPSLIATAVGESLGPMGAGAVAARGLMAARGALAARGATKAGLGEAAAVKAAEQAAAKFAPYAGAAGEGLTMSGSAAEQIRQETPDGLLTLGQSALAGATGLVGGAVGVGGAKLAQRLGVGDADTMLAQGMRGIARQNADEAAAAAANPLVQQQAAKSIPRSVIEGAISEGLFEELPQSVTEQVLQNIALGKDWHQDVDAAVVMGALSGGAMGGAAAGFRSATRPGETETRAPAPSPVPPAPGQPPQPGPVLGLPAPDRGVIEVASDGTARTPAYQAPGYVGDVTDVEPKAIDPVREQVATAAAQGGALSSAALTAIDTGAAAAVQPAEPEAALPAPISLEEADAHDRAAYEQFFASADAEPVVARYFENDDDIPDFDAASNVSDEEFLRALGATDEDIQDAIATTRQPASPQGSAAVDAGAQANEPAGTGQGAGADQAAQGQVAPRQPSNFTGTPTATMGHLGVTARPGPGFGLKDALAQIRTRKKQDAANAQAATPEAAPATTTVSAARPGAVEAAGPAADVKAITAKQIPDMTDVELQQAIAHYGPTHNRTAKLQKEVQRRAAQTTQGSTNATQTAQAQQASPQPAQAGAAPAEAPGQASPTAPAGTPEVRALSDGISVTPGKGLIKGKFLSSVDGDGTPGGPWTTEEDARNAALQWKKTKETRAIEAVEERNRKDAYLQKLRAGHTPSAQEVERLGLRAAGADLTYFIPRAADLFGITSREVRPLIADLIRVGHTDMGAKRESVNPMKALAQMARAGTNNTQGSTDGTTIENPGAQAAPAAGAQGKAPRATTEQLTEAGAAWTRMPTAERQALAERTDVKPVLKKNLPGAKWENLNVDVRRKLAAAMAPAAQPAENAEQPRHDGRYELPAGSARNAVNDEWSGSIRPDFKPSPRQQLVMDAVAQALDDGAFYNRDVDERVARALKVTPEQRARNTKGVEGGDFGYDVYLARKAVEAQRGNAKSQGIARELNLMAGDVLGTLVFNDGKVTTGVTIKSLNETGLVATIAGKRGAAVIEGEVGVDAIASALDRAKERGKRKDGYVDMVARRSKSPAGRASAPVDVQAALAGAVSVDHLSPADLDTVAGILGVGEKAESKKQAAEPRPAKEKPEDKAVAPDRFANNKLFTADKVAAARERMRKKLGTLNSGIDPELLVDGMTVAGAYIESGVRNFTQYAKAMIEDMGDGVKPYLLSFWEGARNFPGLDAADMTDATESARQHQALLTPEVREQAAPELGAAVDKPAKRTKKTGANGDMTLTQDWGVEHIDGYGDSTREVGNDTKDAFLKEARQYLNAVASELAVAGFEPHADRKGKPGKAVNVNESGMAGSGDVRLTVRDPESGTNLYVRIGDSTLRGMFPSTPSGISVLARTSQAAGDTYATKGQNRWMPVDLSASDLSALLLRDARATMEAQARTTEPKEVNNGNPEQAGRAADQGRAPEVSGRGSRDNDSAAPADFGDLESRQPGDVPAPADAGRAGGDGVRVPAADVGRAGPPDQGGNAGDGRTRASGAPAPDAGAGKKRSVKAPEEVSPANPGPGNFHLDNPLEIVGGTPVARFDKNTAAIELLNTLRESERQATAEEQRTLAGYTGWGSFGQELFQGTWAKPMPKQGWEKRDQWLRDHLGQDEWESAQRSITNAHYTDPPTVMAMWDMVKRMGFGGGRVLEPSMGIGNFFGMMPADIKGRSQLAGIELDSLTGAMATRLYPDANIKVMGYQESKTPDNFYDVVIGNWPFENTVIADRRYNTLSPFLHDYFFLKALDQVRPGGLVVGITSNGTMDKKATRIRAALARKAELVTSIRLPSGAFKEYAGTSVVTDIVILKKRDKPLSLTPNEPWINSVAVKTPAGPEVFINEFYAQNPGNVIGTTDYGHGTTRMQPGMIVHRPENMAERLRDAVNLVPEGVFTKEDRTEHISYVTNHTADREGSLSEQNGALYVVRGEHLAPAQDVRKYALKSEAATAKREQELRALIDMRRKYAALIEAERDGNADSARKTLRDAYEAFGKEHGNMADSFGLDYLRKIDDPFYPALAALTVNGKPSDILSKSTIRGARGIKNPTPQDAYVLARNKSVEPSLSEIAALAGKPEAEVRAALVKSGAVFEAPNSDVVPSDIYLSGNVRQKLREAQAALDDGNKAMERNVAELKKVIPEDVPYFNIESQLGATWVPAKAYAEYVAHMLNRPSADGIEATFLNGRWKIRLPDGANHWTEARTGFGTGEYPFSKLVNAAFTNQTVKIRRKDSEGNEYVDTEATDEANARIGDIRTKFGEWLWSDPERRAGLEAEYNESRNAYATPKYDGSFLHFDGMALSLGRGPFNLRQHQVNAIWRALVNRRSLNAHEVGTGKTFTMGGIAVESRRYGIAKKPVLLAHNANSASVAAEIQQMYPAAKVLYIDNLDKDSIAVRMRQIANDDWDTIVMPHSLIDRLSFREETLMEMAREDIRALEEEAYAAAEEDGASLTAEMMDDEDELKKVRSVTAKELVKARNRIIETIKKQAMQSSREGAIPFEDLGIDMVLVDEAHEFKKPPISTRMNMKGLNTQTSNRSIALQFITRYIRANNFGGNVHTFTGTPITNTLTEIFHQMRYVMEDEMKAVGVESWDGWFGSFAKEVQDVELSAAGEYEAINRLAGFINVPELRRMIGQYMDVVFADDMPEMQPRKVNGKTLTSADLTEAERAELLNGRTESAADRPYKKVVNVTSDLTDEQSRIFSQLQGYARSWRNMRGKERMEAMRNGSPESPIITEGLANKASFDVRLMQDETYAGQEGKAPDSPGSKASKVVGNVLEIYKSDDRAAQVIFAEQGFSTSKDKSMGRDPSGKKITRRAKTFSTMRDIVERLVQGGIPREQIAIVDGSTSKEKRKEIADAMNALTVRVVIGSTDTLGVGVNMQRNLRAMHHMDAPYMPGELEQRNGRGLRQGNQWNTVLEYRYMTDRLDGRRWQILAIKQRFITAFMKANSDSRVIEGDAASDEESDIVQSFSEAAGDPRILIRAKLRKNVEALQRAERMHGNGVADARRNMRTAKEAIEWNRGMLRKMQANDLPARLRAMMQAQSESFLATVQGTRFDVRKDAEEAIDHFLKTEMRMEQSGVKVATYRDQIITARWPSLSSQPELVMDVDGQEFSSSGLRGLEQQIRNFPGRIEKVQAVIAEREGSIERLEQVSKAPFARAADLDAAQKRLQALEKDIEVNPVPPPAWLRAGAPVDSEAFRAGKPFVVTGHRWTKDGWFVLGQDDKGEMVIPYNEVMDAQGMPLYDEREFQAPEVIEKEDKSAAPAAPSEDAANFEGATNRRPGTATDRAIMDMVRTGEPARDILGLIAESSGDPWRRELARRLLQSGANPSVRMERGALGEGAGFAFLAKYSRTWDELVMTPGAQRMAEQIFLHEMVHAATLKSLDRKGLHSLQMRRLFEHVQATGALSGHYGMKNVGEFVAEAFTNPKFQEALRQLPAPKGGVLQNAWDALVRIVRSIVGLPQRDQDALARALELGAEVMREDKALRSRGAGKMSNMASHMGVAGDNSGRPAGDTQEGPADGFVRLYHGGGSDVTEIKDGGSFNRFDGLFASDSRESAASHGTGSMYTMDVPEEKILTQSLLDDMEPEQVSAALRKAMHWLDDADFDIAYEAVIEDKSDRVDGDDLMRVFREDSEGEASWEAQRIRGKVAKALGYQAVEMNDEHGTSYLVLPGTKVNRLNEPAASDGSDAFFGTADLGDRMGAAIKSVTATGIKQRAGFKATDYLGLGLQALGRRQIVDIYGDMLPLAEYNQLVTQMEADKNEGGAEADQLVTRWAKLSDEGKLADLMHDATLAQIDTAKPYVDGDDKARYMTLQGRFNALSAEAKQVYTDTRDSYQAHHARVRSAIKERIERSEIKGERKAALLKQMDDEFFKAIKGVYFPLARFGQYAVTVKGPDGKVESVSRAETKAEAEELRNNLLAAFPREKGFTVGRVMLSKDFIADRDAVGRGFMTELYQVLDKQDMDAAQRAELEDTLGQLYLSSLPDLSWAKHGIHRKGTPGFSQDARRAYAQNMFHGARYLAKLRYSDLMQDELTAMQKHVDDWREVEDFDQNSAQRVVDEMNKRHESLMNPKSNPLSTALTSLGFVFHLGLSPASAMVNLSQTALVAYPIMGAKWGFGKASAALLQASKQAAAGKNDITGSLNADERAAYDEAVRAGTIDVTMAHDLAGIAQGEDAGVMWKLRPVMRWASFLFHNAERFNRQVTFVAAYRLAREAGAESKVAFEQATKATYDGHFDYGAANRPRVMQGNVAKVLLLFKQYGQNMVYTLARNAQQSLKGETPEVRAQARKALGGLLAMHAAAAGVLGLPMVTTLLAAASMLGGDDDEPWDAKVALQNMLADAFGQKTAEVLAHGLSRLTPWDISGRVGLDRLIFPDVQEGLEGQRLAESAMAAALGPVAGIGVNVLKGAQHMSEGRYAMGLEAMLPSAMRGPVKALRYAEEGVQDKSGISILDQVSPAAVAGQALGFSPSVARNAQEGKSAILAHDRALGERRQELLTKIARATMAKDEEAKAEAREEIRRFNEKNPGRRINPNHIMASVRGRQKRIDQAQDGVYLPRNRREAMEAGRFATSE